MYQHRTTAGLSADVRSTDVVEFFLVSRRLCSQHNYLFIRQISNVVLKCLLLATAWQIC